MRVRAGLVSVEQKLRKTTGKRADFGATQMRYALLPALYEDTDKVVESVDQFLTEFIAANF